MYAVDEEGFLDNPADWDDQFVADTAEKLGLTLTDDHHELILATRQFFEEYGFSPSMRPLVKFIGMQVSPEKGRSIYLMQLFPPSPAKLLSQLAGLHKPKNCL